jgi:hypothetical protein
LRSPNEKPENDGCLSCGEGVTGKKEIRTRLIKFKLFDV